MRVYQRSSGKWAYAIDAPGSTRKSRIRIQVGGFKTEREAELAGAARLLEVNTSPVVQSKMTVRQLVERWLSDREKKLSPKTVQEYRFGLAKVSGAMLDRPAAEIAPLEWHQEWERMLLEGGHDRDGVIRGLAGKTVRNIAGVISSAYRWAQDYSILTANPITRSNPPSPRTAPAKALTAQMLRTLLAAAPAWLRAVLELAAATGARRGELLALSWSDIDGDRLVIGRSLGQTRYGVSPKSTKTGNVRRVTLGASALSVLEQHRSEQDRIRATMGRRYRGDLIFAGETGEPLRPDTISAAVSRVCRQLYGDGARPEWRGVSLHTLRHTHVSTLIAAGMELPAIAARVGHSTMQTTAQRYAHLLGEDRDREAARRWEEMTTGKESGRRGYRVATEAAKSLILW